jgi:hypothetical protein
MALSMGLLGAAIEPTIVADNLQINLDAGNTSSYPGSGSTWFDIAGGTNNDNGTINGPSFVSNGKASYFSFDGVNDGVQLANNSTWGGLSSSDSFTISVLAYINPSETNGMIFSLQMCNAPALQIAVTSNGSITFRPGEPLYTTSGTDYRGSWKHFTMTYTGANKSYAAYINGSLVLSGTQTFTFSVGSTEIWLGRRYVCGSTDELQGFINNFLFYRGKALSQEEVSQNFEALRGRFNL